jgi:tetratricopeptide (TPR) repeat protein
MLTRILIIWLVLISFSLPANSQSFQQRFKDLVTADDTTGAEKLLKEWEKTTPKDPELFVAYFNYYVRKSRRDVVSMDTGKSGSFIITDTATGKPVGSIGSSTVYDPIILQKGFDQINKGIALYPTRLDLRFGKIYMLGVTENFSEFTKNILVTIDYANTIKYAWMWKDNEPLEDPKEFFLSSMQDYVATIYNTENDSLLPFMRDISERVLKYNPTHVESLSNVAITYLINEDYDKALTYLLKAEIAAPKDIVVLNNIAEAYKRKGDKPKAKSYFEKIIKYGTPDDITYATEKIKEL